MVKVYRQIVLIVNLLRESIIFILLSLRADKLRTFLSIFGVTIGVFSMVSVFSAIDSLKANVKKGIDTFGSTSLIIEEYPWQTESSSNDLKAHKKRPAITIEEFRYLKEHSQNLESVAFLLYINKGVSYKRNSYGNPYVYATTIDWDKIYRINIYKGRYFSQKESASGSPVAIIGDDIGEVLFKNEDPIGKKIKIGNNKVTVIGILKKAGVSLASIFEDDISVLLPLSYARTITSIKSPYTQIFAKPKVGVSREEAILETRYLIKTSRRLKPSQNENFAINEMTFLLNITNGILSKINIGGWVIGAFSLLIGAFGIANIMFVSVKERTCIIGLQRALGAKRYIIIMQFLSEAIVLSVIGGLIGIMICFLLILTIGSFDSFEISLSIYNVVKGVTISFFVGIISGSIPALQAARLNPADAINSI